MPLLYSELQVSPLVFVTLIYRLFQGQQEYFLHAHFSINLIWRKAVKNLCQCYVFNSIYIFNMSKTKILIFIVVIYLICISLRFMMY